MKRFLQYPFLLLLLIQLIVVLLLVSDIIFLATAVKLLVFSTSFYSVVLALYSKQLSPILTQKALWLTAGFIVFLASIKLITFNAFSTWYLISLLAFQVQLFLSSFFTFKTLKIGSWALSLALMSMLLLQTLSSVSISFFWFLVTLTSYSILLVINVYLNFKANE